MVHRRVTHDVEHAGISAGVVRSKIDVFPIPLRTGRHVDAGAASESPASSGSWSNRCPLPRSRECPVKCRRPRGSTAAGSRGSDSPREGIHLSAFAAPEYGSVSRALLKPSSTRVSISSSGRFRRRKPYSLARLELEDQGVHMRAAAIAGAERRNPLGTRLQIRWLGEIHPATYWSEVEDLTGKRELCPQAPARRTGRRHRGQNSNTIRTAHTSTSGARVRFATARQHFLIACSGLATWRSTFIAPARKRLVIRIGCPSSSSRCL